MPGNEACAEGALYAGCRFFAGYPITPSSEIAELMASRLPKVGGAFLQLEDEIASMAAIIGASLAGLKALTATSGPGFSLKQENIGFAAFAEVPCVIVNVQRHGPSTGYPTAPAQQDVMQARWGTHGDHPIVCLAPSTVQECFEETVRAFNISEKYRTPVVVLPDEIIGHTRERIDIPAPGQLEVIDRAPVTVPPEEYLPYDPRWGDVPPLAPYGEGYRFHVTGLCHAADGFPTQDGRIIQATLERIHRKITNNVKELVKVEELHADDARIGVVSFGATARSARLAVTLAREKGIRAGLLRLITLWPFPDDEVLELATLADVIVVPEMNLGQVKGEVERAGKGRAEVVGVNRVDGEGITPQEILDAIVGVADHGL